MFNGHLPFSELPQQHFSPFESDGQAPNLPAIQFFRFNFTSRAHTPRILFSNKKGLERSKGSRAKLSFYYFNGL